MKYIIEKESFIPGTSGMVYLENKRKKNMPMFHPCLDRAVRLTENEAYEWLGRLWSMLPEVKSIKMVKINRGKLDYTELY